MRIVGIGFIGSLALTFLLLGCVLSGKWWTLLIFIFFAFIPIPLLFIEKNDYESFDVESTKSRDMAIFCCTGIVMFTLAFPIFLARTPIDNPNIPVYTCVLTEISTFLFIATFGLFFADSQTSDDSIF